MALHKVIIMTANSYQEINSWHCQLPNNPKLVCKYLYVTLYWSVLQVNLFRVFKVMVLKREFIGNSIVSKSSLPRGMNRRHSFIAATVSAVCLQFPVSRSQLLHCLQFQGHSCYIPPPALVNQKLSCEWLVGEVVTSGDAPWSNFWLSNHLSRRNCFGEQFRELCFVVCLWFVIALGAS